MPNIYVKDISKVILFESNSPGRPTDTHNQATEPRGPWTTTTTTTTVLRPFVRDYPGEPVPEETLAHPPYWSASNLYQLLPSTTIHSILPIQITCLTIFLHNLSPFPLWSIPLGLEPHIPYISSPNQCLPFAAHAHTIATCFAVVSILYHLIPSRYLNSLLGTLPLTLTWHIVDHEVVRKMWWSLPARVKTFSSLKYQWARGFLTASLHRRYDTDKK